MESVRTATDIGLENRKLLERLLEEGPRVGLGAIHSLDQGRVQLMPPLVYGYQVVDDEVVASIEEFGVYGVGLTEGEAVEEVQDELWSLFQDLDRLPQEELGGQLAKTLRVLRGRLATLCRYLKLTPNQFKDLCECRMTGPQYHRMIRDKLGMGS